MRQWPSEQKTLPLWLIAGVAVALTIGAMAFASAYRSATVLSGLTTAPAPYPIATDTTLRGQLAAAKKQQPAYVPPPLPAAERIANRRAYARFYENTLLDNNMNVDVTATGEAATTLTIKYVFVSKVMAHQLAKDQSVFNAAAAMGFKLFVITNGYDQSFAWDLTK